MLKHQTTLCLSGACPIPNTDVLLLPSGKMVKPKQSGDTLTHIECTWKYEEHRNRTGKEPSWVDTVPKDQLAEIRLTYYLRKCEFQICGKYPYTGISYLVMQDGLCEQAAETFNLYRLDGIHQLGFLQAPNFDQLMVTQKLSQGNRWIHSLDVMTIATLMGHNNRLSQSELNTLRLAGLTHDMCTPAGGDSVKLIDLRNLDEDANYPAQLDATEGWPRIAKEFAVDRELLVSTIANQGLLGELLDIADKIAYTARDLHYCLHHLQSGKRQGYEGPAMLFSLVEQHPLVCSLWDSVVVRDGKPVFMDPERLFVFLKVRTLMFRELYYSSTTRFGEYLIAELLAKLLYKRGVLTKEKLLSMRDEELFTILQKQFGEILFRIVSLG
ncbi:MAG: HDc protein, partial [Patescibacteria group bacterium]|nr:HDc protein [Patescibacteria group bacterium]